MADVVIFGSGPAGLASSIVLRKEGLRVVIIDRGTIGMKSRGESLAGSAKRSLIELGVWEEFLDDGHQPCHANSAAWGAEELQQYSFVQSVNGPAWHIDRGLFDQRLKDRAESLGVQVVQSKRHQLSRHSDGSWQIVDGLTQSSINAPIIIEATGRSRWVARQLGARRLKQDSQVALIAFLASDNAQLTDSTNLVESVEDGWWYSSLQPDGTLACIFFSDPDLHDNLGMTTSSNWYKLATQSKFTHARIKRHGYKLKSRPFYRSANSSVLAQPLGDRWVAIGDAAISYDPLSSHGLSLALVSGIDAAQAILDNMNDQPLSLLQYAATLQESFLHYAEERFRYYLQEQRWADATYWKRRHSPEAHFTFLEKYMNEVMA